MGFQRIVTRQLPDKTVRRVYPFHISLEGMESVLLCRDDEDYDTMIKYNHICSWVNNVLVIIEIAMSNHGHVSVLAQDYEAAERTGECIKKNYSQYLTWKYGENRTMKRADGHPTVPCFPPLPEIHSPGRFPPFPAGTRSRFCIPMWTCAGSPGCWTGMAGSIPRPPATGSTWKVHSITTRPISSKRSGRQLCRDASEAGGRSSPLAEG